MKDKGFSYNLIKVLYYTVLNKPLLNVSKVQQNNDVNSSCKLAVPIMLFDFCNADCRDLTKFEASEIKISNKRFSFKSDVWRCK